MLMTIGHPKKNGSYSFGYLKVMNKLNFLVRKLF